MNVKYLKNPDTKEKFYPITQSDCIIDSFSINDLEIDRLFSDSLSVSKYLKGMSYLNLQGLIHYHSKIKDYINEIKYSINIPEVLIYTAGENIIIENNVISAVIPEVDLSGYATEAYVDLEIANIDIPSLNGYATESWVQGKGYLTEHLDISGKADISALNLLADKLALRKLEILTLLGQVSDLQTQVNILLELM